MPSGKYKRNLASPDEEIYPFVLICLYDFIDEGGLDYSILEVAWIVEYHLIGPASGPGAQYAESLDGRIFDSDDISFDADFVIRPYIAFS